MNKLLDTNGNDIPNEFLSYMWGNSDFPLPEKYTCDECSITRTCTLAYDLYNTNGDCLADK